MKKEIEFDVRDQQTARNSGPPGFPSDNPFQHTYIFSREDLKRGRIKWYDHLWLWMYMTYTQTHDGLEFEYKRVGNQFYLLKVRGGCNGKKKL